MGVKHVTHSAHTSDSWHLPMSMQTLAPRRKAKEESGVCRKADRSYDIRSYGFGQQPTCIVVVASAVMHGQDAYMNRWNSAFCPMRIYV
jgi:hypothetical protein